MYRPETKHWGLQTDIYSVYSRQSCIKHKDNQAHMIHGQCLRKSIYFPKVCFASLSASTVFIRNYSSHEPNTLIEPCCGFTTRDIFELSEEISMKSAWLECTRVSLSIIINPYLFWVCRKKDSCSADPGWWRTRRALQLWDAAEELSFESTVIELYVVVYKIWGNSALSHTHMYIYPSVLSGLPHLNGFPLSYLNRILKYTSIIYEIFIIYSILSLCEKPHQKFAVRHKHRKFHTIEINVHIAISWA